MNIFYYIWIVYYIILEYKCILLYLNYIIKFLFYVVLLGIFIYGKEFWSYIKIGILKKILIIIFMYFICKVSVIY